jgi:hypothetical protein
VSATSSGEPRLVPAGLSSQGASASLPEDQGSSHRDAAAKALPPGCLSRSQPVVTYVEISPHVQRARAVH